MKPSRIFTVLFVGLLSFSTLTIFNVKAQEDKWTTLAPMPNPRAGLGAAAVNGKIYAIGGHGDSPDYPDLNTNEEYDPETGIWTSKLEMPTARSAAVVTVQDKIYAIGGIQKGAPVAKNEVYDPATNTWTTKADMPTPRGGFCANVVNDKIYVIGGYEGGIPIESSNKTEVYDPITDTWTRKADIVSMGEGYCSAVFEDKIYVFTSILQIYDTISDSWSYGPSPPIIQTQGAAILVNHPQRRELIYIFGGGLHNTDLDVVQIFDPISNSWGVGAPMPTDRKALAVAVVDGFAYAIGGFRVLLPFNPRLSVNERYTPLEVGSPLPTPTPTPTPTITPTPTLTPTPTPTSTPSPTVSPTATPTPSPEPFPTILAATSIIVIIVIGTGVIYYFKKYKKKD